MRYPKKETGIGKLAEFVFRNPGLTITQILEQCADCGKHARDDIRALRGRGIFVCDDDATISLSDSAYRHYAGLPPVEKPKPVIVPPRTAPEFQPLKQAYIDSMQRAMRLEDGHEPMRFVTMSGPIQYRELGNE